MTLKDHRLAPATSTILDPVKLVEELNDDAILLRMRNAIDKKLAIDPRDLNLANELGAQYRAGKNLLAKIQDEDGVPANQLAQVFNSVGTMLQQITKQMGLVYDAERLKRYEAAFMKTLEDMPDELKHKFFDLYGDYLKQENQP